MTRRPSRVPVGLRLAVCLLPREVREEVLGDLLEKWTRIESTRSRPSLFLWVWRQPVEALLVRVRLAAGEPLRPAITALPGRNDTSTRSMGMAGLLSSMFQDVRIAVRSLARRPGFAALAVMTIAIGIGSSTAVFSIVDGVLLTPLPFTEPQELVMVWPHTRGSDPVRGYMSKPDIESLRQSSFVTALEGIRATGGALLTGVDTPEVVPASIVTGGLMELLGARPALGRDLRHSDSDPDAARVVVVSHRFWQTRLAGSSEVIGSNIELSEERYEVVGVALPSFDYPTGTDLWYTYRFDTEQCGRGCAVYRGALARLAGGVTLEGGQAAANTVAVGLSQAFPDEFPTNKGFWLESLMDYEVGDVRTGLWITLGAVGLVLLIVCANTANLLLVRASGRAREVAVRASLGASRGRLVLQVLAESVVLALGGGLLGLLFSVGILRWVEMLAGDRLPRMSDVTVDGSMMVFLLTVTSLVTVGFGLRPALHIVRHGGVEHLLSASRRRGFPSSSARARSTAVAAEVALCIVTLVGAGLLVRSLDQLYRVDMGFDGEHVTRFSLIPPAGRYPDRADLVDFFTGVEDAIANLPGVESVGSVFGAPLGRDQLGVWVSVEGSGPDARKGAVFRPATAGYFEAMGIPILRGRGFEGADGSPVEPVAVLNELAALRIFGPDEDPMGRSIRVTSSFRSDSMRVVGIVGNVRRTTTAEPLAAVYPFFPLVDPAWRGLTVHVKTGPSAGDILPAIRHVMALIDANMILFLPGTVSEARRQDTARTRFFMSLLLSFALTAVVLAGVGLYGVIAFLVAQRTPEIGLRMALGAGRSGLTRLVVSQGLWPTAIGLVVGLLIAGLGGRVMESLLFGVEPSDPLVLVAATSLVCIVAIAANLVPTRSAMRVDPAVALRAD